MGRKTLTVVHEVWKLIDLETKEVLLKERPATLFNPTLPFPGEWKALQEGVYLSKDETMLVCYCGKTNKINSD